MLLLHATASKHTTVHGRNQDRLTTNETLLRRMLWDLQDKPKANGVVPGLFWILETSQSGIAVHFYTPSSTRRTRSPCRTQVYAAYKSADERSVLINADHFYSRSMWFSSIDSTIGGKKQLDSKRACDCGDRLCYAT